VPWLRNNLIHRNVHHWATHRRRSPPRIDLAPASDGSPTGVFPSHESWKAERMVTVDPKCLRGLAERCRRVGRNALELESKEEFRKMADELSSKADELDQPFGSGGPR
jgi:hypothetical protein